MWSGSEGICWLLGCKAEEIESGAFYLDRQPFPKHVAGLFATEARTPRTQTMKRRCLSITWRGSRDDDLFRPSLERTKAKLDARVKDLEMKPPSGLKVEIPKFMKDWHVLACSPIMAVGEEALQPRESYRWDEKTAMMKVNYTYYSLADPANKQQLAQQHGFLWIGGSYAVGLIPRWASTSLRVWATW